MIYSSRLNKDVRFSSDRFGSVKLWWLLDVASANEPAWSEERTGVAKPERVNPRQLGGVDVVRVVTVRVTRV